MTIDEAREYVVIVNGGSGCIFQPSDPNYTYILTANHNIQNSGNVVEDLTRFTIDKKKVWHQHEIPFEETIEGGNYFPHPILDIAILKIPRIEEFDKLFRLVNLDEDTKKFNLFGYPNTRREANADKRDWFRPDKGVSIMGALGNQRKEAQIPANPGLEEIQGHSGGCIVKIHGNNLYLAGIQNSMISAVGEQLGRVEFTPIEVYDEIIEIFPDQLSPLLPAYLLSFSFLQEKAFDLKAGWDSDDIEFTKNYLRYKCREVIENDLTPITIKNLFSDRLLINSKNTHELECKTIWVLWLEFLTILNIFKNQIHSMEDLSGIFNEYRLFFSNTQNDWSDELENLAYSDYHGLPENAMVIIGVQKSPELGTYVIKPDRIPLIGQARKKTDRSKLRIDEGFKWPYDHFRFVHIDYFKKGAIVDKRKEYAEIDDEGVLLEKLKEVYEELFKS